MLNFCVVHKNRSKKKKKAERKKYFIPSTAA